MATNKFTGTFAQIVYSPKGGVEGFLMSSGSDVVQFVIDKDDEKTSDVASRLVAGQQLVIAGEALPPSNKGPGNHAVLACRKIVSVEGKPPLNVAAKHAGYSGKIVRLNYAKHGAPNGFVLDGGDFIHVKPEGFAKLQPKIGDTIRADGDAHFLSTGNGWAVEATSVNGKALR